MNRDARTYLMLMAFYTLASSLSNTFLSVFIWKLNPSFTLLARYSLVYSLVVVLSFPLCAAFVRRKTPMASMRVGIGCFMATFLLVLLLQQAAVRMIDVVGLGMGLGASFFAIGMHMQALDNTQNHGRDRFLYIGNLLNSFAGMVGPLVAGALIQRFAGMRGYDFVFGLTVFWFLLAIYVSFRLKGKPVSKRSHLWDVWRRPSREWRGMYWVTVGSGFVEGTYQTFLVTMMGYSILHSELGIGGFATFAGVIGLLSNWVLAKVSRPERRLAIYSVGALILCASSIWIAAVPTFWVLVGYTIFSTLGMNLISTTFNAWTYASIESDADYANRRLDYIVVREIPLGVGRSAGIFFFLAMQWSIGAGASLGVTFAMFGSVFLLMIPLVAWIWRGEWRRGKVKQVQKATVDL